MKRLLVLCCALVLALTAAFPHAAHAADVPDVPSPEVCYPTSITQSEDGTEIRKAYDLSPDQSPAGIPRSDFEQGGFHYTLIDLLQQEMPEYQEREHTEQVSVESPKKDMEWVTVAMNKHGRRLQLAAMRRLKQYKGKWVPANQTQNLPHIHQQYRQKIPSVKYRDIYVGFTSLTFCKWEQARHKNQAETPYTEAGRQAYFQRTKKKRINARLDEMYPDKTARASSYGQWGKLNNFEFIMNRAYALNRDRLKCRVCGGWLISSAPWTHRVDPHLPLDKVNRVNNLVSLHKKCFMAVNDLSQDISEFDEKAQKKILSFREKLVNSHTCNN